MEATATRESYREVLSWLRGGDTTPDPVMEDRFLSVITSMVQERLKSEEQLGREAEARRRAEVRRNYKNPLSLRSIMTEMQENGEIDCSYDELFHKEAAIPSAAPAAPVEPVPVQETPKPGDPQAGEYDSVAIGKAFRYIGISGDHTLNMSQIQILMYITYGLYLASTGKRLTGEHPQMWQFGPVFPRAYNKIRKDGSDGKAEYDTIAATNPRLAEFMLDQFHRFGFMSASLATVPHISDGSPWAKTRKGSPDKWGVTIADSDIREWFAAKIAGK